MKWHDKRDVIIISSEFGVAMKKYRARIRKITKNPEAVQKYNEFMVGVDRSDQLLSYYRCERKTLRWCANIGLHTVSKK